MKSEKDNSQGNLAAVMNDMNMTKKEPNKLMEDKFSFICVIVFWVTKKNDREWVMHSLNSNSGDTLS